MIAEFSITPLGAGESLSREVAKAFAIIRDSGLRYEHHAMGTNLEGDWDEVLDVIKACRDRLRRDHARVSISLRIDDRASVRDGLRTKVASAQAKLDGPAA
jgi:uncharacterized protein (TIGR00106 family)